MKERANLGLIQLMSLQEAKVLLNLRPRKETLPKTDSCVANSHSGKLSNEPATNIDNDTFVPFIPNKFP